MKRREVLNLAQQTYKLEIPDHFQCKQLMVQATINKLKEQNTIEQQQKFIRLVSN